MRASKSVYAPRQLVAFALAASIIFSLPTAEIAARPGAPGETIAGSARVIDGDTISIGEMRIRLEGIDAPEVGQTCQGKGGTDWPCGSASAMALEKLIAGNRVRCDRRGLDKYGRALAVCFVRGRDINAEMVRQGHAWVFEKYSASYVKEQAAAKAESRGIWQASTMPAWDYRQRHWDSVEMQAPNGCAIKGNITKSGRIYHMPWSPWYAQITIDPDKGKRWFCTEADAIAAGWRPVHAH